MRQMSQLFSAVNDNGAVLVFVSCNYLFGILMM